MSSGERVRLCRSVLGILHRLCTRQGLERCTENSMDWGGSLERQGRTADNVRRILAPLVPVLPVELLSSVCFLVAIAELISV